MVDHPQEFESSFGFGDPSIQNRYEAALGKFLVEFNRIEHFLNRWIARTLADKGLPSLSNKLTDTTLKQRLQTLILLAADDERIKELPLGEIGSLSVRRNTFAHGHFDQNPNDGTFDIIGKTTSSNVDVDNLLALAKSAQE